jgi:methyl-accepting chemotaxis protein
MALKKHTATASISQSKPSIQSSLAGRKDADELRKNARTMARKQQAAERIAVSTAELLAGLEESSSAMSQLRSSMEQVSVGAEESSSACQQSETAVSQMGSYIDTQRDAALSSKNTITSLEQEIIDVADKIKIMVITRYFADFYC